MPQLNALRAFEAAARLGSFARAADELCVTAGAIAQHVKSLEAWTGDRLFKRHAQGTELTALGARALIDFAEAFDHLGLAVQRLRSNAAPKSIRIAALPSIAQLWLSPRLPAIRAMMPDVSISVTALERMPNLKREPFDLAIFFEDHPVSEHAIVISRDIIYPVCSPMIVHRLEDPSDLANETLLHDTAWQDDWRNWLAEAAPGIGLDMSGPAFSLYALAIEETRNGAGVLIGHDALVRASIDAKTLVAPFSHAKMLDRSLVISTANAIKPGSILETTVIALSKPRSRGHEGPEES